MVVRRPRVFEKRILRKMFCPKRVDVVGEWRKLYNEQLRYLKKVKVFFNMPCRYRGVGEI
jgi:hypothetical protein